MLIAFLIFGTACGGDESVQGNDPEPKVETEAVGNQNLAEVEKETAAELIRALSEAEELGPGKEWSIIAIARSSLGSSPEAQTIFTKYQDNLRLKVKKCDGVLDPEKPTDNAKAAIAVKIMGGDPSSVEGYDLLKSLDNVEAAREQGINAEIWALIAAGVCGRELAQADAYLDDIIAMQNDEEGGITYDGENMDVDITAMAIQAMALYPEKNDKSEDALAAARGWLSTVQNEAGDYGNAESTAQVILALSSLGEDPDESKDFIKGKGNTLFKGLMKYRVGSGFCHSDEEEVNAMATEQALCALDAMLIGKSDKLFFDVEDR